MYRTFIIFDSHEIQGVVLSNENEIIAINSISYTDVNETTILNTSLMSTYISELIGKLEQHCTASIQNIKVFLHGFIPYHLSIKLLKENESINISNNIYKFDSYQNYYINGRYYSFLLDTKHEVLYNHINVYINTIYIETLTNIFRNLGINIEEFGFVPLQIIKNMKNNSMIAFLYNNRLTLAVNKCGDINIYNYDNLDTVDNIPYQLNYLLGNLENVQKTRKLLNKTHTSIQNIIYKDEYNLYYTSKFFFIPDLLEYVKYYYFHDTKTSVDFLNVSKNISVNTIKYGCLLYIINLYI